MSKTGWSLAALGAAAIALLFAAWYDARFMLEARVEAAAMFDSSRVAGYTVLGSLMVAGSVLLVGFLAWRAASSVVGLVYVVVGAFVAALPWLVWTVAAGRDDAPPVLPESLAAALTNLYISTVGPLGAVGTIGAGMLIAGVASLVHSRPRPVRAANPADGPAQPEPVEPMPVITDL